MELLADWLHGTDVNFTDWEIPTPPSLSKPELLRHTAAFLTKDKILAMASGPLLCKTHVRPTARILNVLQSNEASEAMRSTVVQGKLGRYQTYAQKPEWWTEAWRKGLMMRFATQDATMMSGANNLQRLARQHVTGIRSPETRAAWLEAQNLTRAWIEELTVAARHLGFDALVGREIDSHRTGGSAAPEVLFALTNNALHPPIWIQA